MNEKKMFECCSTLSRLPQFPFFLLGNILISGIEYILIRKIFGLLLDRKYKEITFLPY